MNAKTSAPQTHLKNIPAKNKCESSIVYSRWKCNMFNSRGKGEAIEELGSMEIQ